MTDHDAIEMKQKVAEYERLVGQSAACGNLISGLSNIQTRVNMLIEFPMYSHTIQLKTRQVEKFISLLNEFRDDFNKEMEEL